MKSVIVFILLLSMLSFVFMPKKGVFHLIKFIGLAIFLAMVGLILIISDAHVAWHPILGGLIIFGALLLLFLLFRSIKNGPVERCFVIYKVFRKYYSRRKLIKKPYLGVSEVNVDMDIHPISYFACSWSDYFKYKNILQEQGTVRANITYYPLFSKTPQFPGYSLLYKIEDLQPLSDTKKM